MSLHMQECILGRQSRFDSMRVFPSTPNFEKSRSTAPQIPRRRRCAFLANALLDRRCISVLHKADKDHGMTVG